MPERMVRAAVVLALLTATLLVPAFAAPASAHPVPGLEWGSCGDGRPELQCTTVSVPLDYDRPYGRRITLHVTRLPATDPARRIGSLFINPGGPGGDAYSFLRDHGRRYPAEVRARFDIVGMDPRGIGRSTPVRCFASPTEEAAFAADYPVIAPVGAGEERRAARKSREFAARCWLRNVWLLPHLSTANVARDMDALRAAVGDERLTYAGYSYGTYLGATYANLFPRRVRALVLDGVVDPTRYQRREPGPLGINAFLRAGADIDADATLGQFLRLCGSAPARCAFGAGHDPRARFTALAQRLRRSPIQVPDGAGGTVRVGFGDLVNVTLTLLYAQDVWPILADALAGLDASGC